MNARRIITTALAAGLALGGCQRQADDGPTELSGRIFVFNYRVSAASYMIVLKKKAPIPRGALRSLNSRTRWAATRSS